MINPNLGAYHPANTHAGIAPALITNRFEKFRHEQQILEYLVKGFAASLARFARALIEEQSAVWRRACQCLKLVRLSHCRSPVTHIVSRHSHAPIHPSV
jgi:hypothetical protein